MIKLFCFFIKPNCVFFFIFRNDNKVSTAEKDPEVKENNKSVEQKRKSVEDKLNAVFEKRISISSRKQSNDISKNEESEIFTEKNTLKANSTGNIRIDYSVIKTDNVTKTRSEGSSRNDSLENVFNDLDENQEGIGKRNVNRDSRKVNEDSAVNVSVITSTPIRSRSVSRSESRDNIVVITGNFFLN